MPLHASPLPRTTQFLVGPDGRTVKRYAPLTLVSEVLADYYQMRVAADDLDYLPSTFDKMMPSNVPVTGRWRRRLNPAANAHAVQALVMASAILALILYPASAASSHPPRRAAVDGTLLAAAVVLLLDTLARFLATALPYSLASLGFWVGIFTSFSLALDITFFAEEWAVRCRRRPAIDAERPPPLNGNCVMLDAVRAERTRPAPPPPLRRRSKRTGRSSRRSAQRAWRA